ncbi:MAG TPA: signal peptidase I, partial [Cytophagaceae bacterium]
MKAIKILFLSILAPGLGCYHIGEKRKFYIVFSAFFAIIFGGAFFRLFPSFLGFVSIASALILIYIYSLMDSLIKGFKSDSFTSSKTAKAFFTFLFLLITGLSFSNPRSRLGFDRLTVGVPAMEPTLMVGEQFLVDSWAYNTNNKPARNEIIIHAFPGQYGIYINRIIAVGGDKVAIENGQLILNGVKVEEPYTLRSNMKMETSLTMDERTIPKGQYFVLGDHRDKSGGDSRFSGNI